VLSDRRVARSCGFVALQLTSDSLSFRESNCIKTAHFLVFTFRSLCFDLFVSVLSLTAFTALALLLQHFTLQHSLDISGQRIRRVARNRFPIKYIADWSAWVAFAEANRLNRDVCKSEWPRSLESNAQSAYSSKACSKPRACNSALWKIAVEDVFPIPRIEDAIWSCMLARDFMTDWRVLEVTRF